MSKPSTLTESMLSAPIDLYRVRQLFAHPKRVQESDFLRREVASRMFERLSLVKIDPQRILDAGCGEGADLFALRRCFSKAHMIGLDASTAMLLAARGLQRGGRSALHGVLPKWLSNHFRNDSVKGEQPELLTGNFAQLPFAANSFDLVWSNLALHWHPQPDRVYAEWRRVLRVDGLLMFSCFGPDTFKQLRMALAEVDQTPHLLPFVDMHDFGDMLVQVGFSTPVMDMETITITYETVDKLLNDVRAFGGNPLANRRRGLIGRHAWARALQVLDRCRQDDGRIPLSFEIIYGHAFRPVSRTTSRGESIIHFK